MLRTTLRSLWSHKRRLVSTCVAIILGVAFMAGTLVLNGTVGKIFDDLFAGLGDGIDAQVRGPEIFSSAGQDGTNPREKLPESAVAAVEEVDGVEVAEGSLFTLAATVVDTEGDALGGAGPPVIVGSWTNDPILSSYQVVEGAAPAADGEAVIDMAGKQKGDFSLGDTVTIITGQDRTELELVGFTRFGDADSAGGSIFVATTLDQAQEITGETDRIDTIDARAVAGVTPEELVERIEAAGVAPGAEVLTGEESAAEQANDVKSAFGFFTVILTIFGLIALFVGWFIISNTFSILVAQRTRELALLRAIGASRRQVLTSVLAEACIIGLFSGVIGLGVGVLLAYGALELLRSVGLDMPSAGIVVPPSAIVVSVIAGLAVTLVAALSPAVRATRVKPIAALREGAIDSSGSSKGRAIVGSLLLLLGLFLSSAAFSDDPGTPELQSVGMGVALILFSVLVLGPVIAGPLARAVGSWIPAVKGVIGTLARQNAVRNPRRTASTAAAIIIGVALVTFITVFAQSATTSINKAIGAGFNGDYVVSPSNAFGLSDAPLSLVRDVEAVPGVERVSYASVVTAEITFPNGDRTQTGIGGLDPATVDGVFDFKMSQGRVSDLDEGGILVGKAIANDRGLSIGDELTAVSLSGEEQTLVVAAISDDQMLGPFTTTPADVQTLNPQAGVFMMGITLEDGVSVDSVRPVLKEAVEPYPQMQLQDRDQFTASIVSQITSLLYFIYGLLAVSIVISLIGIANTLSLSIHERTRELGLLRAMGMTRAQMRSSVRWEALIVALIGTILGMGLGLGLSWLLVKVLVFQGITDFSAQPTWMVTIALIAAGLALFAAILPARRASKLNVLEAIATD